MVLEKKLCHLLLFVTKRKYIFTADYVEDIDACKEEHVRLIRPKTNLLIQETMI